MLNHPISQPNFDISPIWITLVRNEVLTHREDLYEVTDSPHLSINFSLECSGLTPQMALVVYITCLHTFSFYFFAMMLLHLVLSVMFIAQISTSFSVPLPRMCVLYHNLYCVFSCYLPPN
jgi:hypothetical protein